MAIGRNDTGISLQNKYIRCCSRNSCFVMGTPVTTESWASEESGLHSANKGQQHSLVSQERPGEKLTLEN